MSSRGMGGHGEAAILSTLNSRYHGTVLLSRASFLRSVFKLMKHSNELKSPCQALPSKLFLNIAIYLTISLFSYDLISGCTSFVRLLTTCTVTTEIVRLPILLILAQLHLGSWILSENCWNQEIRPIVIHWLVTGKHSTKRALCICVLKIPCSGCDRENII